MIQMILELNWSDCSPVASFYKPKAKRRFFGKAPKQLTLNLFIKMSADLWGKAWKKKTKEKNIFTTVKNAIVNGLKTLAHTVTGAVKRLLERNTKVSKK